MNRMPAGPTATGTREPTTANERPSPTTLAIRSRGGKPRINRTPRQTKKPDPPDSQNRAAAKDIEPATHLSEPKARTGHAHDHELRRRASGQPCTSAAGRPVGPT
ncbi:hypothetical protein GCM10010112_33700 [Actinoplanes lobatus]|uniref:Uncharacterized protein n=1 Tax=Actinoplanes lobatus TaxID=113568 RepID=A0ABQ4AMD0_9ACTN|nr:hypothetical protein GCM10010112_33700 [Actinoplanes lobatus]GIE42176.1 hypothetical protein Alo02nite_50740 [Actinoplanes lobatus]